VTGCKVGFQNLMITLVRHGHRRLPGDVYEMIGIKKPLDTSKAGQMQQSHHRRVISKDKPNARGKGTVTALAAANQSAYPADPSAKLLVSTERLAHAFFDVLALIISGARAEHKDDEVRCIEDPNALATALFPPSKGATVDVTEAAFRASERTGSHHHGHDHGDNSHRGGNAGQNGEGHGNAGHHGGSHGNGGHHGGGQGNAAPHEGTQHAIRAAPAPRPLVVVVDRLYNPDTGMGGGEDCGGGTFVYDHGGAIVGMTSHAAPAPPLVPSTLNPKPYLVPSTLNSKP